MVRKGVVFKTYEGKMIQTGFRAQTAGAIQSYEFAFSVDDKASRAVDANSEEPLYMKALSRNSKKNLLMNFQQLKPQCCDVFVWVAVFRDEIVLWVMNSREVSENNLFSKGQHRGNSGNEGQLHVKHDNIHNFDIYELKDNDIESAIRTAASKASTARTAS